MKNCRFKSKTNICCFLFTIRLRFFLFFVGFVNEMFQSGIKKDRKRGTKLEKTFRK